MSKLNFGIDKLTLSIPEFDVSNYVNLNITPNSKRAGDTAIKETHLFNTVSADGELIEVNGSKAFINLPDCNLTFKPYGDSVKGILQFNPSKMHGSLTTDANVVNDCTFKVVELLKQYGVSLNIDTAQVSRLDLGTDNQVIHTFREYREIIHGKTENKRTNSTDYLDTKTFGSGKGTMQFSTYDKGKEMECEQYGKPLSSSTHHARFEARIFKSKGIKRIIGEADTYNKLLETNDIAYKRAYLHVVNSFVDLTQTDCDFPDITSLIDIVQINRRTSPKIWLYKSFLAVLSAYTDKDISKLTVLMSDAIREAIMQDTNVNTKHAERTINKAIRTLQETATQLTFQSNRLNEQSTQSRIDKRQELIDKFITPFRNAV